MVSDPLFARVGESQWTSVVRGLHCLVVGMSDQLGMPREIVENVLHAELCSSLDPQRLVRYCPGCAPEPLDEASIPATLRELLGRLPPCEHQAK